MATKTQTKTEIRNNTAKIGKLLRGIDNETLAIKKDQSKLNARVESVQKNARFVQTLIGGISNTAISVFDAKPAKVVATKPAKVVAAKPAKPAKPAKVVKVAPVKVAKPVVEKPAKVAKPVKASDKANKVKVAEGDRPPLKKVIADTITSSGVALSASEIYQEACKKHGYWSRQSLYNALKDKSFTKTGEKYSFSEQKSKSKHITSDDEADNFVKKVEGDSATATLL